MKGYKFFIPKHYEKNKDKPSQCYMTKNKNNIITFSVRDAKPVDDMDVMPDSEREVKLMTENVTDDFLKNLDLDNPNAHL